MGDTSAIAGSPAAEDQEAVVIRQEEEANGNGGSGGSLSADEDSNKGGEDEQNVNISGNRWPRQETLALLKLRSDMDATFRDSSLKTPLWEEISRKLGELGYKRSAKKCKEKFENVYKYHKRTKDGRRTGAGKSEGKTYRYFQELEVFDHQNHHPPPLPPLPKPKQNIITTTTPWTTNHTLVSNNIIFSTPNPTIVTPPKTNNIQEAIVNQSHDHPVLTFSNHASSSSTASDEEFQAQHKRKRKWKDFFRRLTRRVVRQQEEMQKRFLETVAKCESERAAREESWRSGEMLRISREHELLLQERSTAAAKEAALMAFLEKVSGSAQDQSTNNTNTAKTASNVHQFFSIHKTYVSNVSQPPSTPPLPRSSTTFETNTSVVVSASPPTILAPGAGNNMLNSAPTASSSRWPKAEVEALINLRTTLELKYHENGPKGPLWEEISAGMRWLGYDRSSKRCKEKWENINKYFKKVKDNDKKRSEDSKTCPYFHKLDALYRKKRKNNDNIDHSPLEQDGAPSGPSGKAEPPWFGSEPLMVQPERQWPLHEENNLENIPLNSEEQDDESEADEDRDSSSTELEEHHHHHPNDDHDDCTGSGASYGIIAKKHSSMDNMVE